MTRICMIMLLLLAAASARAEIYRFAVEEDGKMYSLSYDGSKVQVFEGSEVLLSSPVKSVKATVDLIAFFDNAGTQIASLELPYCCTRIGWLQACTVKLERTHKIDYYNKSISCYSIGSPDKNQKAFINEFNLLLGDVNGTRLKTAAFAPEKKTYPSYSSIGKASSKSSASKSAPSKSTVSKSTASKPAAAPKPEAALPKGFSNGGYVISPVTLAVKTNRSDNRKYISIGATVTTPSSGFTYVYYFLGQDGMPLSVPKELKLSSDLRHCVTHIDGRRTVGAEIRGAYKADKSAVGGMTMYVDAFRLCSPVPKGIYCVIDLYDGSKALKARQVSPYLPLP